MKHLFYFLLLFFIACRNEPKKETTTIPSPIPATMDTVIDNPVNSDSLVWASSREVLSLLKSKAFLKLSEMFHPVEGVRFSPYGYVDTSTDRVFFAATFIASIQQKQKLNWGNYDGSGDSIVLTTAEYYNKFIYNADFLNAAKTSINKRISAGNSLDNLAKVYPGTNYTEHFFPGFDKKYAGMDWTTLKLVFKFYQGKNWLVGIVHDQWTS